MSVLSSSCSQIEPGLSIKWKVGDWFEWERDLSIWRKIRQIIIIQDDLDPDLITATTLCYNVPTTRYAKTMNQLKVEIYNSETAYEYTRRLMTPLNSDETEDFIAMSILQYGWRDERKIRNMERR